MIIEDVLKIFTLFAQRNEPTTVASITDVHELLKISLPLECPFKSKSVSWSAFSHVLKTHPDVNTSFPHIHHIC